MQFGSSNNTINDNKINGLRIHLVNLIILLIVVFSFTTTVQSLFDRFSINRIIGGLLAVVSALLFFIRPEIKSFYKVTVLFVIALISLVSSVDISKDLTDFIYLFATILMILNISNKNNTALFIKSFNKFLKPISFFVIVECGILLVLLLTKKGYAYHWGESRYFLGLCNGQHTMASLCCLIVTFTIFIILQKKKHLIFWGMLVLIPSYAIFETGARVFLFPLAILLFFLIQISVKRKAIRISIYSIGIVLFVLIILHSSMLDKFQFVTGNSYAGNLARDFSSGRTEFWKVDLELFASGNFFQIIFGRGFASVYLTNLKKVSMEIWAHNDIIHLLVGTGICGAYIYISIVYTAFRNVKKLFKNRYVFAVLVVYVIVPMLLNGFFVLQHYVYSFVTLYLIMLNLQRNRET